MNRRTRFRIFVRDGFTCQYCGKKAPETELHVDHRHPKSKGGKDTDDNFVTACITCNSGKSDMVLPVEYVYHEGPREGNAVRRRDPFPVEWVWEFADHTLFSLNDAWVETGIADERRFVFGPQPFEYSAYIFERFQAAVRAKGNMEFPDGRRAQLLGAYVGYGVPLATGEAPLMHWYPCDQIVLQFTITVGDLPANPGTRRAILDG